MRSTIIEAILYAYYATGQTTLEITWDEYKQILVDEAAKDDWRSKHQLGEYHEEANLVIIYGVHVKWVSLPHNDKMRRKFLEYMFSPDTWIKELEKEMERV